MCGEDGIKRAVYNVKREHARKEGSKDRKEQREDSGRKGEKQKNCIHFKEKPIVVSALIHQ